MSFSSAICAVTKLSKEIGVLTMKRPPVNALNRELVGDMTKAIQYLESDKECISMILAAENPKIFSAGLDITEFYKKDTKSLSEFWTMLQDLWISLYGTRLATFAAINGVAQAGGCLLALACDYRIMKDSGIIGLNETKLGLVAPHFFKVSLFNTVGQRQTEKMLATGALLSPQEAQSIGLVDKIAKKDLMEEILQEISIWNKVNIHAREATKIMMRKETLENFKKLRQYDLENFVGFVQKESVQDTLGAYIKSLQAKKN